MRHRCAHAQSRTESFHLFLSVQLNLMSWFEMPREQCLGTLSFWNVSPQTTLQEDAWPSLSAPHPLEHATFEPCVRVKTWYVRPHVGCFNISNDLWISSSADCNDSRWPEYQGLRWPRGPRGHPRSAALFLDASMLSPDAVGPACLGRGLPAAAWNLPGHVEHWPSQSVPQTQAIRFSFHHSWFHVVLWYMIYVPLLSFIFPSFFFIFPYFPYVVSIAEWAGAHVTACYMLAGRDVHTRSAKKHCISSAICWSLNLQLADSGIEKKDMLHTIFVLYNIRGNLCTVNKSNVADAAMSTDAGKTQ